MNIAVDAFALAGKHASGISNYTRRLLSALVRISPGENYFLYSLDAFESPEAPNVFRRTSNLETGRSYINTLLLFTRGVQMMKKDHIDLFWGPRQMLPPVLPKKTKKVLTVHDLVWKYYPESMSRYNRLVMKLFSEKSIPKADHILADSEATALSLKQLGIPGEKITVIYPAADDYKPLDKTESARYISQQYNTNKNYILTVSTVEPRKNLITLLRAFAPLRGGVQLLIAGARGWKTTGIYAEYERFKFREEEVKFLGYVPDSDMNMLYSGALLFAFPSIYEGFGMPLLEAMASGTPVISSDASSLPEVAGDAGILLPPFDVEKWSGAISKALSDAALQEAMVSGGLERSKQFSWEASAEKTLRVFQEVTSKSS